MTEAELALIAADLKQAAATATLQGAIAENWTAVPLILGGALSAGFFSLLVMSWLANLFGYPTADGFWKLHPLTLWGTVLIVAGWALWALYGIVGLIGGQIAWSRQRVRNLETARNAGTAVEERFEVIDVKSYREPEHGMFIHFLRLDDGRVRVAYDYESVDAENDYSEDNAPKLEICRTFRLVRFPGADRTMETFSGDRLDNPSAKELTADPEDWPEPESWCGIKWKNLDQRLAT